MFRPLENHSWSSILFVREKIIQFLSQRVPDRNSIEQLIHSSQSFFWQKKKSNQFILKENVNQNGHTNRYYYNNRAKEKTQTHNKSRTLEIN